MKTHIEVLDETERQYLEALMARNANTLHHFMHSDFIYSNDSGELFDRTNLPILNPNIQSIHRMDTIDRRVTFFDNVAVVISIEMQTGTYMGIAYDNRYRYTRIWKFTRNRWRVIATVSAMV